MKTEISIPINFPTIVHENEVDNYERALLCLHGYQLDGRFMHKRFAPLVDAKTKVISPNGPFLAPLKKDDAWEARYSWYFYDSAKKNFYINYEPAAEWLSELIKLKNPRNKPVTILGYSQGGYLAPKVGELISECDKVIGINSIFRADRFEVKNRIEYVQLNGTEDKIVSSQDAKHEFQLLKEKGAKGAFETCEEGHLLNQSLIKKTASFLN